MSSILRITNVKKSFKAPENGVVNVLNGVNLEIKPETITSIIGSSGSGKSTLLHIIAGLDKIDSGLIEWQGDDITQWDDKKIATFRNTEIGFIFQFHHLLPDLTALENIALPALLAGTNHTEAMRNSSLLLEQVNLFGKENNTPNELSGGERQRVAIARAMSNNPSCLIMDEPTGNLDTKNVENFMTLLTNMVSIRNVTLLIATHDTKVSSRLDRLLSLE